MACAIGRGRPGRSAAIIDLQENRAHSIAQTDRPGVIGQIIRIRAEHAGEAIDALQIGGRFGDDQEAAAGHDCARRKGVVDIAGEPEAADVFRRAEGVEQLDVFKTVSYEAVAIGIHDTARIRRVVHDFGNDQARFAAGLAHWLQTGRRRVG